MIGLAGDHASAADRRLSTPPARSKLESRFAQIERARRAARERLGKAACLAVLTDFSDARGRRLDSVLSETGRTAQQQLDVLELTSGLGRPHCARARQLAFTKVGSRVISVCLRAFMLQPTNEQEAVLIHEMLHSLGLGEGPPESAPITAQVLKRCGH